MVAGRLRWQRTLGSRWKPGWAGASSKRTDGTEYEIGRLTAYQPPRVVAFTFRAPSWEVETQVEIRFVAEGDRATRVELEHRGWNREPNFASSARTTTADGKPS